MGKRLLRVLMFFGFLPFAMLCLVLILPAYILTGSNAFDWLDSYAGIMCGENEPYNDRELIAPPGRKPPTGGSGVPDKNYPDLNTNTYGGFKPSPIHRGPR